MGIQHLIDTGGQQVIAILEKFLFIALSLSKTKKRNKEEEGKGHTLMHAQKPSRPSDAHGRLLQGCPSPVSALLGLRQV